MKCTRPIDAYRSKIVNESGKRGIVFNPKDGLIDMPLRIPCGQCIGCRLERSRQWAIRCVHEAKMHKENCFITLTYSEERKPLSPGGDSLDVSEFQKFMKRLRKKYGKIRYFHCGEYGEINQRPHYHACLFGFVPPDRELWKDSRGNKLYVSQSLNKIWNNGYCIIGDVTFDSAAYVARYITKKITGEKAKDHYNGRKPEYTTMSRRPGIGYDFYKKYKKEIFDNDSVIMNGKEIQPPGYYYNQFEIDNPEKFRKVQIDREIDASKKQEITSYQRLQTIEKCREINLKQKERTIEK